MIRVKMTGANLPLLGQTENGMGKWKDCQFFFNDPNVQECDYWFVFDDYGLKSDNVAVCPKEHIYLVMGEAEKIRIYGNDFVNQFYNIVTVQRKRYNVPKSYYRYLAAWFVGLHFEKGKADYVHYKTYSDLKGMEKQAFTKTKTLSIVSSNKKMNEGHKARLKFASKVKEYFGEQVDFWGRGIRDFTDKWDVLAPYKYHIAIENYVCDDYITEKLFDPFLAMTYPIYHGASNVTDYFSPNAFSTIDIYHPDEALHMIEKIITSDTYEKHFDDLWEARNLVLDEYNIFNEMYKIIHLTDYAGIRERHKLDREHIGVIKRVKGKILSLIGS